MTRFAPAMVAIGTLTVCAFSGIGAPQANNSLEAALARMDETAKTFKALTAHIRRLKHTEVISQDDVEEGNIAVKRVKAHDTRILIKMSEPESKSYAIGEGKFRSFNPKSLEAQEADLGKSKDIVNQFMLLGFGSNSSELKAAYTVKLGGSDVVNGEKTTRLEMVPKSEEILKHVKRCEMWVSEKGITV